MKKYKLLSKNISCMHCVMHIKQAMKEIGIQNTEVDLAAKTITLETDQIDMVLKKLDEIGYPSEIV